MQKLGPHSQRSTEAGIRWAKVARVVKAMEMGVLVAAKRDNPTVFTIYRDPHEDWEKDLLSPEELANRILAKCAEHNFYPDAVEYKNEWRCYCWDDAERHIQELERFVAIIHPYGMLVIGGNWSVGTPEKSDVLYWRSRKWGGIDILGMHEYSNKYILMSDPWYMCRYRMVREWCEDDTPPIGITECGIDNVNEAGDGWIAQGMSAEEFTAFVVAYANETAKDACLLFVVVFTSGANDKMEGFETDGISDTHFIPLYTGQEPIIKYPEEVPEVATITIGNLVVNDLRLVLPKHPSLSYNMRPISTIERIVIHHSATAEVTAQAVAQYHVDNNGWPGIGYHFMIHQDGVTEYVQPIEAITYGVAGENETSVHICLTGNFNGTQPNPVQLVAAKKLVDNFNYSMGRVYPVFGHQDLASSECPGNTWPQWKGTFTAEPVTDWKAKYETAIALRDQAMELLARM